MRYAYWRVILAVCILLPVLQDRQAPRAAVAAAVAVVDTRVTPLAIDPAAAASPMIPWSTAVLALLAAGAVIRLAWVGASLVRLRRLRRAGATAAQSEIHAELQEIIGAQCEIRYVDQLRQPVTFGLWRPIILLPSSLTRRSHDIQRAVLGHELFHVKRRDWGWLLAEQLVCAVLWFNPAIWWLVSRVHLAREIVVDELAVLATGRRRAYVEALLAFADETSVAPVAAFGGRRQLFDRLVLLSKEAVMSSHRLVVTCAVMMAVVAAGSWQAMAAFPLTAGQTQTLRPNAPGPLESRAIPVTPEGPMPQRVNYEPPMYPVEARIAGARGSVILMITLDELGRVAEARRLRYTLTSTNPPVSVTLTGSNPDEEERFIVNGSTGQSDTVRSIAAAMTEAAIRSVQQWRYDPPAAGPISFQVAININGDAAAGAEQGTLAAGTTRVGEPWAEGAIRVGGTIRTPKKILDVRPVYPAAASDAGVSGVVILETRIGTDGAIENARVLRSIPLLDQAALDAVMQWRFTPTLMNGQAVPVLMTVTVNFTAGFVHQRDRDVSPSQEGREVPTLIKEVKPVYPPEAVGSNAEGTVETEVTVGLDGKVTDARIVRSIAVFDEAALTAVRQWEFSRPSQPVAVNIELSFSTRRK